MKPNPNRHTSGTQPIALAGRIRLERQAKGWTQAELASSLGTTASAIADIESGDVAPSDAEVDRIAEALGITVEQLLAGPNLASMTKRGVG